MTAQFAALAGFLGLVVTVAGGFVKGRRDATAALRHAERSEPL